MGGVQDQAGVRFIIQISPEHLAYALRSYNDSLLFL
jgi:hypothetical protein